jgi:hypothetical protein
MVLVSKIRKFYALLDFTLKKAGVFYNENPMKTTKTHELFQGYEIPVSQVLEFQ